MSYDFQRLRHYALIKKEALALTYVCDAYTIGKTIKVDTDHEPLLPLLDSKGIPLCILHLRLNLIIYSFMTCHVPGKYIYTTYVLSRSPSPAKSDDCEAKELETSAKLFISTVVSHLSTTHNHSALNLVVANRSFIIK